MFTGLIPSGLIRNGPIDWTVHTVKLGLHQRFVLDDWQSSLIFVGHFKRKHILSTNISRKKVIKKYLCLFCHLGRQSHRAHAVDYYSCLSAHQLCGKSVLTKQQTAIMSYIKHMEFANNFNEECAVHAALSSSADFSCPFRSTPYIFQEDNKCEAVLLHAVVVAFQHAAHETNHLASW